MPTLTFFFGLCSSFGLKLISNLLQACRAYGGRQGEASRVLQGCQEAGETGKQVSSEKLKGPVTGIKLAFLVLFKGFSYLKVLSELTR